MIRLQITLGLIMVMATILIIGYIGLNEPARLVETERQQESRTIENGAALFEQYCRGCHGPQGQGILGVAPALNSQHFFKERLKEVDFAGSLESYTALTIAAGRPLQNPQYGQKMPTWGQEFGGPLRDDQIEDLVAFIMNWESTATAAPAETPTPVPTVAAGASPVERGRAVFLTPALACAACHAIEGDARIVGPSLFGIAERAAARAPDMSATEYIRQSILDPNAYVVEGFQPNLMPGNFGDRLSEQELDDLVAFLESLK